MKRKLSEITVPEGRRRTIDHCKARGIAESIKLIGLINPISIDRNGTLIAGVHWFEAYKFLGH